MHPEALRTLVLIVAIAALVVITGIGVATERMRPDNAAAMVGDGLLSVVILPIIGLAVHQRAAVPALVRPLDVRE